MCQINGDVCAELGESGSLYNAAVQLSGAKALLQAVLQLGLPYTLQRDDALHGFLFGSQPLVDMQEAYNLISADTNMLATTPNAPPLKFSTVANARLNCFSSRLQDRLSDLAAMGQPELPRLVGHTLRLLNLLLDSHGPVPAPSLETARQTDTWRMVLYGEPYANYTLQYCDALNGSGWTATTNTNLQTGQTIAPPLSSGAQRFYRALLPLP